MSRDSESEVYLQEVAEGLCGQGDGAAVCSLQS